MPINSYLMGGKLTGLTSNASVKIRVTNRTTGDYIDIKTASDGKFQVNAADLKSAGTTGTHTEFSNAQIIDFRLLGDGIGGTQHTLDTAKGSVSNLAITGADMSSTNVPKIEL